MSPSADPRAVQEDRDGGFSLVEVIVALGVIMIVMTALLPQLIVGIKSTGVARNVTQAKGVAQGELDRMRNLPFRIAPAAGPFIDVLDNYFHDMTAPTVPPTCKTGGNYNAPQAGWKGYVGPGNLARCDYEPATGAFYRTVKTVPAVQGSGSFTIVTATQFLDGNTPPQPVTPRSDYKTSVTGQDTPASAQIGVNITVLYSDRATLKPVSTYTQIAQRTSTESRLEASVDVTALEVGSSTTTDGAVSLSAGIVNLAANLSTASTVRANLAATSAGLATGDQDAGALETVTAPPVTTAASEMAIAGGLDLTCLLACWDATRVDVPAMTAGDGLPNAGTATTPMLSMVTDKVNGGVRFGNGPVDTYRPGLLLQPPLLMMHPGAVLTPGGATGCQPSGSGTPSYLTGGGYLRTTAVDAATEPSLVETCGVARAGVISILPTTFAPKGLVQLELVGASARCTVSGASHGAAATYDYKVKVRIKEPGGENDYYDDEKIIDPSTTDDLLAAVDLESPVSLDRKLGDYIASWSSLTPDRVSKTQVTGMAEVDVPGVVTLTTAPLRPKGASTTEYDEGSAMSVTIGAVSCSAKDAR